MRRFLAALLVLALAVAVPAATHGQDYSQWKTQTGRFNVETVDAYQHAAISGVMAINLAANSEVYQFRWTSTTHRAVVQSVHFSAANDGTAFVAGSAHFDLYPARTWTAAGTGGTVVTPATNDNKSHVLMATSRVNEIRIASTAALTAGTKTLDAQAMSIELAGVGVAAGADLVEHVDLIEHGKHYPLILSGNEGFMIRATVPGSGTWKFHVEVEWMEIPIDQVR